MSEIQGLSFVSVYVEDFEEALKFYQKYLGYEEKYPMEEHSSWGMMGDLGFYIEGKNKTLIAEADSTRSAIVFRAESAGKLFETLSYDGIETIQDAPVKMGEAEDYWFQFKDTAGNILEVIGGK